MDLNDCFNLYKENLCHAFNEVKQLGKNITGKTKQEKRFQSLEQFTNMGEDFKELYEKYSIKYEALAEKMGLDIAQDKII